LNKVKKLYFNDVHRVFIVCSTLCLTLFL